MSVVHLHLLLNHVPVIGLGFVLLVLLVATWRRSNDMAKLALFLLAGLAAVTAVVFLTGEPAEEAIEHVAGISESLIHEHEEAAEAALGATVAAGTLALGLLAVFWRRQLPRWATVVSLLAVLAAGGFMAWTANLGGQIRHTEIQSASSAATDEEHERR